MPETRPPRIRPGSRLPGEGVLEPRGTRRRRPQPKSLADAIPSSAPGGPTDDSRPRGGLDDAAHRAEILALVADLVVGVELFLLQLGDFLGAGPDDGAARVVGLVGQQGRPLHVVAEGLLD